MRIRDWSSDVCSSDLHVTGPVGIAIGHVLHGGHHADQIDRQGEIDCGHECSEYGRCTAHVELHLLDATLHLEVDSARLTRDALADQRLDRKRVESGNSVSVCVYLGCPRLLQKK